MSVVSEEIKHQPHKETKIKAKLLRSFASPIDKALTPSVPPSDRQNYYLQLDLLGQGSYLYLNPATQTLWWVPKSPGWVDLQIVWIWFDSADGRALVLGLNPSAETDKIPLSQFVNVPFTENFGLTCIYNLKTNTWSPQLLLKGTYYNGAKNPDNADEIFISRWTWNTSTGILSPYNTNPSIKTTGYGVSGWKNANAWSEATLSNLPQKVLAEVNGINSTGMNPVYFRWTRNTWNSQTLIDKIKQAIPLLQTKLLQSNSIVPFDSEQEFQEFQAKSETKGTKKNFFRKVKSSLPTYIKKVSERSSKNSGETEKTISDKEVSLSVEPIQWNNEDSAARQKSDDYPYVAFEWGSTDALKKGVGVLKSAITKSYTNYNPGTSTSDLSLINLDIFANVIQVVLSLPNGPETALLSDNFAPQPGESFPDLPATTSGRARLSDYVFAMLKKTGPSVKGTFDMDRLQLRQVPPRPQPLPLPYLNFTTDKAKNSIMNAWSVVPPLHYVNVGEYIENEKAGLAPPAVLVSILNDSRFCQPPQNMRVWVNSYYGDRGFILSQFFNKSIKSTSVDNSGKQISVTNTYQFGSFLNFFWNPKYFSISQPIQGQLTVEQTGNNSYPSHFPWTVNTQLFRFFANGPGGTAQTGKFEKTGEEVQRNLLLNTSNDQDGFMTIANPTLHISGTVTAPNTYPVVIPMSLTSNMDCCAGVFDFKTFWWDPTKYPPLPSGETNLTIASTLSQIICQAQNWSFNYEPSGVDCIAIGRSICNPGNPEAWNNAQNSEAYPNCACWNSDAFIKFALGDPVPIEYASTAAYLSANIQCVYIDCSGNPKALRNPLIPPNSGVCPNSQTCIISNVSITTGKNSPVDISNSCTSNTGPAVEVPDTDEPGGPIGTASLYLIVIAVVAFFLAAILLLLFRKRKTKKAEEQEMKNKSKKAKETTASANSSNEKEKKRRSRRRKEEDRSYLEDSDDVLEEGSDDEDY